MKKFKAAICQIKPSPDKKKSVEHAMKMLSEAAGNGADLALLPEIFYHNYELKKINSLAEKNHETLDILAECAKNLKIHICSGSTAEVVRGRKYNKSCLIAPDGNIILEHSKCHMFDVDFKDLRVKESSVFTPGNSVNVVKTKLGTIGILVCYDIRFPEMARKLTLMGAEIILVPAAFNNITGPAHWHLLCRTRAMENQIYLAAASPARDNKSVYKTYGHSMLVSPWGTILAETGSREEIIYAEFDPDYMKDVRGRLPLFKHRRPELYK